MPNDLPASLKSKAVKTPSVRGLIQLVLNFFESVYYHLGVVLSLVLLFFFFLFLLFWGDTVKRISHELEWGLKACWIFLM